MSLLQSVSRTRRDIARKIVIYGGNGVGKSTWASVAPNPIYIRAEDNLAHLDVQAFPKPYRWDELTAQLDAVYTEPHNYQTLIVDTLDEVQKLIEVEVCREGGKRSMADFGFGKGEKMARDFWLVFMDWIDSIVIHRNITCVLVAHADVVQYRNPEGDDYDKFNMRLHKWATNEFRKWANDVLFAQMPVIAKKQGETDGGKDRRKSVGVSLNRRILRTVETGVCFAKNQCGLPPEIPLSWADYAAYAFPNGVQVNQPTEHVDTETGEVGEVDQGEWEAAEESQDGGGA
jgi:hypothetical protein